MQIAELARSRRQLWIAAAVLATAQAVTCVRAPRKRASRRETTQLYVELTAGATLAGSRPEFTHLRGGTDDVRARWRVVDVPVDNVDAELAALIRDPSTVEAFRAPDVALAAVGASGIADDSCPITTPSFESYQGYLGAAPHGIDAPAAWRRGVRGQGVWFADVEGAWNTAHEDLPGDRIAHAGGVVISDPSWRMHGTAVLGEVVGRDNAKGVVGIAPDVERVFTSSIGGTSVADAIDAAAERLRAGDVLLIELQSRRVDTPYLPVEFWDDSYAAIRSATERGVVIVEAAGNGGANLDRYRNLKRSDRDSGAIMVGAGAPPRDGFEDRSRLEFSNYGSRVDVQGWGRKVATLDYGDLQACDGGDRHYTDEFSGTSSASPIVAGAAVLVESYARTRSGMPLSPADVRTLLRTTGTAQTGDLRQPIGPRPNLARAFPALQMWQR